VADIVQISGINWGAIFGWGSFAIAVVVHFISAGALKGTILADIKSLFEKVKDLEAENKAGKLRVEVLEKEVLEKLSRIAVHVSPCLYTQEFKEDYDQTKRDLFDRVGTMAIHIAKIKGALGVKD
jgi:hypothetical protein